MKTTVHTTNKRDWGKYETLVTVVDDNSKVWNFSVETDKAPKTQDEILVKAEATVTQWITNEQEASVIEEANKITEAKTVIDEKLQYLKEKEVISEKDLTDVNLILKG